MGMMLKLGTEGAKSFLHSHVLPEKYSRMHKDGYTHIHDADFSLITTNCIYIDLKKMLKNGFSTGHGFLREPNSIRSAAALACIIIQSSQNDCYGG
jgi:ribonucleoside-triphosphate reductase